ncbi:hypothetical protein B0H63DRAFT_107989 [Podospora didyma]|uniref:Ankyrin repeat containing protein n=1 Tax=Podospora didyma TaxID=330526 RepID=A0AAE0NYX8_9PEZI|nr:hypothetical protein B0H63DRAFT_107989 [Podospora didyma]
MASSPMSRGDPRQARLEQLARAWGVSSPAPLVLPNPSHPPSFRGPNDDFYAEDLLKRQRLAASQDKSSQGGIKRAFSSNNNKKAWEPKEIGDALEAHINKLGAPGVAEALIDKLRQAGGNLNVASIKNRTSLITRKKSTESTERSRILQTAVENRQIDMVSLLVHHADPHNLDAALPAAIRTRDVAMVRLLVQRGASASQTQDGQDAFRQACITGGHADIVGLILQSEGRPTPGWLCMCMVDAARIGCVETVLRLSRSQADGEYQKADALRTAISQCRVDVALAILTGLKPPISGGHGLAESFTKLFEHPTIGPNEKMTLTEALLCAGAEGDAVSDALYKACDAGFYEMVDLLVSYGASVEFQNAVMVRDAISRGNSGLVQILLNEKSTFSPTYASECVKHIPKAIAPEERHAILSLLLRKGAVGTPLNDALVDSVQMNDLQSVELLVTPFFPGRTPTTTPDTQAPSRRMVYDRHHMAAVDYNNGVALDIAIRKANLPMIKQLLVGKPSSQTLQHVFPLVIGLPTADRYHVTELFLSAGVTGPCVAAALQRAIEAVPPHRDERLISLLLRHNPDVNYNDGAGILAAVTLQDLPLLEQLLSKRPSPQTTAAAMAKVMAVTNPTIRFNMTRLLIAAGAGLEGTGISEALKQLLGVNPIDMHLLGLLVEQGRGDANFDHGAPVVRAIENHHDPVVLDVVLQHGKAGPEALSRGLDALFKLPTDPAKVAKINSILRRTQQKDLIDNGLMKEVELLLKEPLDRRPLAVVQSLLSVGADVNFNNAKALCSAVEATETRLVDLLLSAKPVHTSLAQALSKAMTKVADPKERLILTKQLIDARVPNSETKRALKFAIVNYPSDLPLIGLLAGHADSTDGEALKVAIQYEHVEIANLVLGKTPKKYSASVLESAFQQAMAVNDRVKRLSFSSALLQSGVSGPVVSNALLTAASDGDIDLGAVLVSSGASVEHQEGQAVIEACGAGAPDVLGMLLTSEVEVNKRTLEKGFQAATQVGNLDKRAEVFRLLLEKGVTGDVVDAQLVSAAKFGDEGEPLVRLLLDFGACVDYNSGEAIWNSTRSAMLGSLKMMLGLDGAGTNQKRPSAATMLRALKASRKLSRDPRYQVIEWLFEAGLPPSEEIDIALNRAVKDEPDLRLVQLLLRHGASPLANACETLTDASQLLLVDILAVLLESEIPERDVSWAFRQAFTPETATTWLSEQGFQVAKMLLDKGAQGESLTMALSFAIDSYGSENDSVARQFCCLLLRAKVDVNFQQGLVLQKAAKIADSELIHQVLEQRPNSLAVSMAFPYIFDSDLLEDETLQLMLMFTEYHHGEERLDTLFAHPQSEPVVFRALDKFPRSVRILEALLDAGFYHDQATSIRVLDDLEENETVTLLFWALLQPQKRISSNVILLLIERHANPNFESPVSKMTPLMLAIQSRRQDLVKQLLLEGADVNVEDITGNTAMTMASKIGGDVGTLIMKMILEADPSINDGSLHNSARELNLDALRILVRCGHDVDYPSTLHDGRSALGELCLNAAKEGPISPAKEKLMEKVMSFLIDSGTDLTLQSDGKTVLLLALHSADPVPTTRALLKVGLWKQVNQKYNHYKAGNYTYSPSQYVAQLFPDSEVKSELITLLKANRAIDVFYANEGPQPEGAVNLPEELLEAERKRRALEERIAIENQEHERSIQRTKELAQVHNQVFLTRAELEDARARRQLEQDLSGARARQAIEEEGFAAAFHRKKAEREASLLHEQRLTEAGLSRNRLIADSQLEIDNSRRQKAIEWEKQHANLQLTNAKQLSAVRIEERQAVERFDAASDARTIKRMTEHKKLVDSQGALATKLANGGVDQRRQIGYITGELD